MYKESAQVVPAYRSRIPVVVCIKEALHVCIHSTAAECCVHLREYNSGFLQCSVRSIYLVRISLMLAVILTPTLIALTSP